MPEWLIERGIGETRAALVEAGEIVEARIEVDGTVPAESVLRARLISAGNNGRNAVARDDRQIEYLLPRAPTGVSEGGELTIEVTREAIPGPEPWKRSLAKTTDEVPHPVRPLEQRLSGRLLPFPPGGGDALNAAGWDDVLEQARTGRVDFAGGSLSIFATPAMTLIDVDGAIPAEGLAIAGAREAARAIRRLGIGGSIGVDLPTVSGKAPRQAAGQEIDAALPQPFERTAVNGFGFVQIVRPRGRASLIEIWSDRAAAEARTLLRRAAVDGRPGAKRLVAHPSVIAILENRRDWLETLAAQVGGNVGLRADAALAIFAGHAEQA